MGLSFPEVYLDLEKSLPKIHEGEHEREKQVLTRQVRLEVPNFLDILKKPQQNSEKSVTFIGI